MLRRRWLWNSTVVLSAALSMAIAGIWAIGLTTTFELDHSSATTVDGRYANNHFSVYSTYGFVTVVNADYIPSDELAADWRHNHLGWSFGPVDQFEFSWKTFAEGFRRIGYFSGTDTYTSHLKRNWKSVEVPHWLLILVTSIPVQIAVMRMIRARNAQRAAFEVVTSDSANSEQ